MASVYSWLGLFVDNPNEFLEDLTRFMEEEGAALDRTPQVFQTLMAIKEDIVMLAVELPKTPHLYSVASAQPLPPSLRVSAVNKRMDEILDHLKNDARVSEVKELVEQLINALKPLEGKEEKLLEELLGEYHEGIKQELRVLSDVVQALPTPNQEQDSGSAETPTQVSNADISAVLSLLRQPLGEHLSQSFEHWLDLFERRLTTRRRVYRAYILHARHELDLFKMIDSIFEKKSRKKLAKMANRLWDVIGEMENQGLVLNAGAADPDAHPVQPSPTSGPRPQPQRSNPPQVLDPAEANKSASPAPKEKGEGKEKGPTKGREGEDGPPVRRARRQQQPPPIHYPAGLDEDDESRTLGARATKKTNGKADQPEEPKSPMSKTVESWAKMKGPGIPLAGPYSEVSEKPTEPAPPVTTDLGDDPEQTT